MEINNLLQALSERRICPEDAKTILLKHYSFLSSSPNDNKCNSKLTNKSLDEKLYEGSSNSLQPENLGNRVFQTRYCCKWNYYTGSMYRGISSENLVVAMGRAGFLSIFGSAGFRASELEVRVRSIQAQLGPDKPYGMCLIYNPNSKEERSHVDVFIRNNVPVIEVAAYSEITSALVYCRIKGLRKEGERIITPRKIIAKCSRVETARMFLSPSPKGLVEELLKSGLILQEEAKLAKYIPIVDDLAVECDSGGHTDQGVAFSLFPTIVSIKEEMMQKYRYQEEILVGCGGGIGTPKAVAAAFMLGADFIFTGSINQCTVESGASNIVKDILQEVTIHDTTMSVSGDMFEIGAKVQVLKKHTRFPIRANKLYQLYTQYDSLEEIPSIVRNNLERSIFKRPLSEVWDLVCSYKQRTHSEEINEANTNPRKKMALIFKWYIAHCSRSTLNGDLSEADNFLIYCGPAMGSFNKWVKGTEHEHWKHRNVNIIAEMLMQNACKYLKNQYTKLVIKE